MHHIRRPIPPLSTYSQKEENRTKALSAMSKIRVLFNLSHDELIFISQKLKEIAEDNPQQ
ncbi:hypothetical protein A6833_15015 [Salmonella enterica]|uniref:Uncharacterized protein n=1 Tax=Salmonella enterica TaxID=28901 RepID=A0A3V3KDD4_SALER|nr:hypothetical protein [Salmonella enterica subsp. enterica serovar Pensacola]EAA7554967.1 hypothetical protein [Salmonella enterica]EBW8698931.1 hypothetical protein [Salmonella enterica subsp. diarizonae serovar 16:z10:e,n,x,z15]ECG1719431.1 hypothetical protein [Salmonella enterica subsp. diarizonae serovar 17:z10:e,n,x,z15]ECO1900754.1 hypothetical protein [Salmonella enterica subsp. diarizonae]